MYTVDYIYPHSNQDHEWIDEYTRDHHFVVYYPHSHEDQDEEYDLP